MAAAKMLKAGDGHFLHFILRPNVSQNIAILARKYWTNAPQQSGSGPL